MVPKVYNRIIIIIIKTIFDINIYLHLFFLLRKEVVLKMLEFTNVIFIECFLILLFYNNSKRFALKFLTIRFVTADILVT
jgi:hypothetical protein